MNELELIICLFPIVFMFHEFEEIIGFKRWFSKNGSWLEKEFPKLARQITHLKQLSVPAFTIAVLEEFIIISALSVLALFSQVYYFWITAFTVFAFHILLHIIQWVMIRKYIPVVITSLLSIPYVAWGLNLIFTEFSLKIITICFIIGFPIAALNLFFIHKLALRYDKKQNHENSSID